MFDIGFPELIIVSIVALLILGPERLPEALRTLGLWMGRLRRSFTAVKTELEKELGMDDIRRQLHNESVMEEMKRIEDEVRNSLDTDSEAASEQDPAEENSIAPPSMKSTDAKSTDVTPSDTTQAPIDKPTDQPTDVTNDRANNS